MLAMIRRERAARVALALFLLQLSSATLSAVADGVLEAQEAKQAAHVERQGDEACNTGHDDLCQICRALSTIGGPERILHVTFDRLPTPPRP